MILSPLAPFLRSETMRNFTRDALLKMDPETAHRATITALRCGLAPIQEQPDPEILRISICGLELKNPVGMAAGFDKNAEVPAILSEIGFGFAEVGTLTPRAQIGNPKPRLFRIEEADGIINRMGFNNEGHRAAYRRLKAQRAQNIVGVNVGANKDSEDFVADYVAGIEQFADVADYFTINISSPNTPGLRDLQSDEALKRLLGEALAARAQAPIRVPVFLKLAPDLDQLQLDGIAKTILATDLDGLIISNTTISRDQIADHRYSAQVGGLSGKPLFNMATKRLAQMRQRVGKMPIIGVGGIHSAESAVAKFAAGADVIQLYSALVFGGMELLGDIKTGLVDAIKTGDHKSVSELSGTHVADWADGKAEI